MLVNKIYNFYSTHVHYLTSNHQSQSMFLRIMQFIPRNSLKTKNRFYSKSTRQINSSMEENNGLSNCATHAQKLEKGYIIQSDEKFSSRKHDIQAEKIAFRKFMHKLLNCHSKCFTSQEQPRWCRREPKKLIWGLSVYKCLAFLEKQTLFFFQMSRGNFYHIAAISLKGTFCYIV